MAVYGRVVTWDWNGDGAEMSAKMDVGFEGSSSVSEITFLLFGLFSDMACLNRFTTRGQHLRTSA